MSRGETCSGGPSDAVVNCTRKSYKPYIIAAMIFLAQVKDPVKALMELDAADNKRKMF